MAVTRNTKGPFHDNTNNMFDPVIGKIKPFIVPQKYRYYIKQKPAILKAKINKDIPKPRCNTGTTGHWLWAWLACLLKNLTYLEDMKRYFANTASCHHARYVVRMYQCMNFSTALQLGSHSICTLQ